MIRTGSPQNLSRRTRLLLLVLAAILAWYFFSRPDWPFLREPARPLPVTPRGNLAADEASTIELFERCRDAVVYISTSERVMDFWSRNVFTIPRGTGSGFIWDGRGHIVTNYHVIQGASEATIRLSDDREYRAGLVGASPLHDLAVLKISGGFKRQSLPIGTSRDLRVGQKVFAIGNPFGLDWTLTTGIVSALDRALKTDSGSVIEHLIQTDAAINPGNSGGPLLDSAGRLIGVNTAIYSPSGASAGVGFAVPVDTVNRVVPQLISLGKYVRPSLGIEIDQAINEVITSQLGVQGVAVLRVLPGSPAEKAGLVGVRAGRDGSYIPGDVITAIQGRPVASAPELLARLDDFKVGETVEVAVIRNGRQLQLSILLEAE